MSKHNDVAISLASLTCHHIRGFGASQLSLSNHCESHLSFSDPALHGCSLKHRLGITACSLPSYLSNGDECTPLLCFRQHVATELLT